MKQIEIKDVSYKIKNKTILSNINLEFNKGIFYSIIGPNGSGKSTIVRAIANELDLSNGQISIMSKVREDLHQKDFAQIISILRQFIEIEEYINVYELLTYGRAMHKSIFRALNNEDRVIIDEIVTKTKIEELLDRDITSLSGGEKQRVLLAMCLIAKPKVLILDEPTNHLDIKFQIELLNIIKQINVEENTTVICIIHDINLAIKFSDEIIVLKDGQIIANGLSKDIINEEMIYDVFEVSSKIYHNKNDIHVDYII